MRTSPFSAIVLSLGSLTLSACQANFSIGYKDTTSPLNRILASVKPATTSTTANGATNSGTTSASLVDQTDDDNSATGFGGGTMQGLIWDGGKVVLDSTGTPTNIAELDSSWTPQYSNIVGYWKLDGALGAIADGTIITGTIGDSGTLTNGGAGTDYVSGKMAQAIDFSSNDKIDIPYNPIYNSASAFSVSLWARVDGSNGLYRSPLTSRSTSVTAHGYTFYATDGNQWQAWYGDGVGGWVALTGPAVVVGSWTYLTMTYDGTTVSLFVNGLLQNTSLTAFSANPDRPLRIGAGATEGAGGFFFDGPIDEVSIWSVALTPTEIKTIFDRQLAKYSGLLTSRVMDAATSAPWTDFTWKSTLPYFKELPDGGASNNEHSTDYSALAGSTGTINDNDLMNGIVGLWHLNGSAGSLANGATIGDASGYNNAGVVQNTNGSGMTYQSTTLSQGVKFDGVDDSINVPISASLNPNFISIAAWVKFNSLGSIVVNHEAMYRFLAGDVSATNFAVRYATTATGWGPGTLTGATPLKIDEWYHAVWTYDGSTMNLYLNGSLDGTKAETGNLIANGNPFVIGYVGAPYDFNGTLDELSVWNRALSATEAQQLYRRGANRLKFQTRSCATNPCTVESWLGPDGTNQTYFSELNNNSVPAGGGLVLPTLPDVFFSAFGSLTVPNNRYFQYRAIFESDDSSVAVSPDLQSLRVGPTR